LLGITSI